MPAIIWFRQDLRLGDNPALSFALEGGDAVIPVYLHAPDEESPWQPGGAARWWLHHSLERLREQLRARGSDLILRSTRDSGAELLDLARETGATRVSWNRRYEPAVMARDARIKMQLRSAGLQCDSFNGALLREPWEVKTRTGTPYQVFTPFWRQLLSLPEPAAPLPAPAAIPPPSRWPASEALGSLHLLPDLRWDAGIAAEWRPGSEAAHDLLASFLDERVGGYDSARDRPDVAGTSRLSPYLHAGNLSPREIWHAVRKRQGRREGWRESRFLAEVIWREFAHHLLYHFPETPDKPLRGNFARFAWAQDENALRAWQRGRTGYPIVDAGMRQLWQTGWMHNRVRMITASFLVKDLLLSWQQGSRWFWDTLVDADLASNTLGWQWSAGCGADAAPYFRIFNPVSQGRKFDPDGAYVRRYVPELAQLPNDFIHEPWNAPADILARARVELGRDYPRPIVDHKQARVRALATLAALKS